MSGPPSQGGRGGRGRGRGRGRGGGKKPDKPGPKKKGGQSQRSNAKQTQEDKEAERLRRQKEAEEKRQAEMAAKEAALLQQKQEAADDKIRQAHEMLETLVESTGLHETIREEMENLSVKRKEFEANKKTLKTDLKKCTAFVKKIKSGAIWSMKASDLEKDVSTLNLSRYVEEVVNGLVDSTIKPKLSDINIFLQFIRFMHLRYKNFTELLIPHLWTIIRAKPTPDTVKIRRLYVRLMVRLVLAGIVTDTKPLLKCLGEAAGGPQEYAAVQDPLLVLAFGKAAGFAVLGIVPSSVKNACTIIREAASSESPEGSIAPTPSLVSKAQPLVGQVETIFERKDVSVPEEFTQICLAHFQGSFGYLKEQLSTTHSKLLKLEQRCGQDRLLSGSLSEAREKGLEDARKLKESLFKTVEALVDVLDESMPILEAKESLDDQQQGGLEVWTKTGDENDLGPFDDEETRAFYVDVPDLLTTIPPALLGLSLEAIEQRKIDNQAKYGQGQGSEEYADDSAEDVVKEDEDIENLDFSDDEEEKEPENEETDTPHYRLMVLLEQELPECHGREQLDEITDKFCTNHGTSRNSRKRLSKTLFGVPRARLDLLPYYSRMTATLDRVWPDIAESLVMTLEQQFHGQAKFKKNQNIEARMKTARYVGELTKFRVAPPMVFLRCLRRCLDDFSGNNVDVACCLLESCGRFLYRMTHTSERVQGLLDTISRLSKAKNLDERHQALIKAAFYVVKPAPSGPKKLAKEYPPLEAYLRHLLIVELEPTDASVSLVVKQLARLPWNDPAYDCGGLVCRIMLKACRRGRYRTIKAIATVAEKLRSQRAAAEASVRLLDAVLEELRGALEFPDFRDQQRTITYARLFGELFCLQNVTAKLVIDQLLDFINVGHGIPDALREASKRLADTGDASTKPLSHRVSQTIQEDEELDENDADDEESAPPQPVAVSEYSKYDPRVPCPADPPSSAYRVKLVCTTLEVTAKKLLTRVNLPRVRGFLAAFQRYLFTKVSLPADVEFSLLDTFDILDSQWKRFTKRQVSLDKNEETFERYRSWSDAHIATVAFEELEAKSELQRRNNTLNLAEESRSLDYNMSDDASLVEDEDDEDVSLANSEAEESLEDQPDSSDEDTETKDVEDFEDEFDEEAYMQQLEEEEFEREIRRLTKEALDKGKSVSRKLVHESMVAGSQVIKRKPAEQDDEANPFAGFGFGAKSGVTFQVLKKGNKGKVEAKDLLVPSDTNLARVASRQDGEAAKERDAIKERVLRYEMDSAEAELTGGNVYLEQSKLQANRNKKLSMDTIDKNFGTQGGNLQQSREPRRLPGPGRGGPGRGRGRGRSTSGRTLFRG